MCIVFTASYIRALLTAKEFKSFAIHASEGARYEIMHRDMMQVSRNTLSSVITPDKEGVAEPFVRCAILHVTRI